MLLRIAPDMFADERFGCITLPCVREEFVRVQRFKTRYPWRSELAGRIRTLTQAPFQTPEWPKTRNDIDTVARAMPNTRTNRPFGLSRVDREIAAAVLHCNLDICTAERELAEFLEQQFEVVNQSPLELVNDWIDAGLIVWDDARQAVLLDWIALNERPQPLLQVQRFEKLARRKYPHA
jgi:hypothetical protein